MEKVTEADLIERLTQPDGPFRLTERQWHGGRVRAYGCPPHTLRDVFLGTRAFFDREAMLYGDERWTYAEQWSYVVKLAHSLRADYGVGRGDSVAIACRNFPEWAFVFWSAQLLGATLMPLNAWLTGAELDRLLKEHPPAVLFADAERLDRLLDFEPLAKSRIIAIRAVTDSGMTIDDIVARRSETEPPDVSVDRDDIATILFTSGTTGRPKAVAGAHFNHVSALLNRHLRVVARRVAAGQDVASAVVQRFEDVKLMAYPLFHIAGISTMYAAAYNGHALALMRKWDTQEAIRIIAAEKVSELSGPPLVIQNLVEAAPRHAMELSSLSTLGFGGAAAPAKLMRAIHAAFEGRVTPRTAYGMTETTSGVIALAGKELIDNPDAIGRPSPTIDIRILGEAGMRVPDGVPGELAVRGPQIFSGYAGDDAATRAAFIHGWFRTGDKAAIDEDGIVRIVGRIKDIVIRGGENIQCAEVESCISEHPDIVEAAAIGVPHPTLGEELAMIVCARNGAAVDPQELRDFVAARLAAFKVPAKIAISKTPLPRTPSGKIVKHELEPLFTSATGSEMQGE